MYEDPYDPWRWYSGKESHRKILFNALDKKDIRIWNRWRKRNPELRPNLRGITLQARYLCDINLCNSFLTKSDLRRADLTCADLCGARFAGADLSLANLTNANCKEADFSGAALCNATLEDAKLQRARFLSYDEKSTNLETANLNGAKLQKAHLYGANMEGANLTYANLDGADLRRATLDSAIFNMTSIRGTKLSGASVKGVIARWVRTDKNTEQGNLKARFNIWVTRPGWLRAQELTVPDVRIASFLSDLEGHAAISHLVTAGIISMVLLLGRFTARRRRVLDQIGDALRRRGKTPVIFDFPGPESHVPTDTVRFIAAMSEFIIVDLTSPKSVPLELQAIVPDRMVPLVPIIESGKPIFSMFHDLRRKYFWVLRPIPYTSGRQISRRLDREIIKRVEKVKDEIRERGVVYRPRPRRVVKGGQKKRNR